MLSAPHAGTTRMAIPTLTTTQLVLRAFTREDVEPLFRLMREPDVLRYFPPTTPLTRERVEKMVDRALRHWDERGYGLWAVEARSGGALMGRCGLQFIPETDEVEIDFLLGKPFWGRGFATEAAAAGLGYARSTLETPRVVGIVHPENLASRRVLEKIGMRFAEEARYFGMGVHRYVVEWPARGGGA